ncbi:MAG: large conductance mechanosensitive channel protein MscL [Verrucomicrobiota bacterium]
MLEDFKKFAFKGNLVDMAVGIIIGGAFGTVVKSLVDDIFMPLLGRVVGDLDFSNQYMVLSGDVPAGTALAKAQEMDGVNLLTYGNFITAFISFLILAFVLFLVIKKFMAALQKEEEKPAEEPKPSEEVLLLQEIRDLLSKQS